MPYRPTHKFKVGPRHYRTRAETRAILGLPPGARLPSHVCKLPSGMLDHIKFTTAQRILNKRAAVEGTGGSLPATPARYTFPEPENLSPLETPAAQ